MHARRLLTLAWLALTVAISAQAAPPNPDWPRFRGPTATGVAQDDPRLPETWSKTESVRWVTEIPGLGWASPIVSGGKIFLTTVSSESEYEKPGKGLYKGMGRQKPPEGVHHWTVYCLDLESGKILWEREAHQGEPKAARHPKSTYASETPVTDGERVYALFGDVGLYCYDFDGKLVWSHEIKPKVTLFGYGAAASPVLCDDLVIMIYDNQEQSYITAFDKVTGEQRWRVDRDEWSTWATPFVWKNDLRTEIITPGLKAIRSYDPGGNLLWSMGGPMSNLVIPSPFSAHGLLYVTSGYVGDRQRPVYVIRPGAEGEIDLEDDPAENPSIAWFQPQAGPYNTSPIVYGDYYYTLHDRGFFTCHDARTGEEVYGKTRFPEGASFTSSPWAYNGKLFCLSEDGDTYVIEPGPEFKVLATNRLEELCMACPAVVDGRLILRTASKVYCLGR